MARPGVCFVKIAAGGRRNLGGFGLAFDQARAETTEPNALAGSHLKRLHHILKFPLPGSSSSYSKRHRCKTRSLIDKGADCLHCANPAADWANDVIVVTVANLLK